METQTVTHAGGVVVRSSPNEILYLLVQAKQMPNQWIFPKGHIEPGETQEEAALREVREEAGVTAKIIEPLGVLDLPQGGLAIFLMSFEGSTALMENRQVRWCSFNEAISLLSFPESRDLLNHVHLRVGQQVT